MLKSELELLKICRTYDTESIRRFLNNYNGEPLNFIISSMCLYNTTNKYNYKVLDTLFEYPNKVLMFTFEEYEYHMSKKIYTNELFIYSFRKYIKALVSKL